MKLSEVPWEQLSLGDKCISAIGSEGFITDLSEIGFSSKRHNPPIDPERGYAIKINWNNGNVSWHPQWCMDNIEYIGNTVE